MLFHEKEPSIVFKDIDLEELQNGKKAFQSSISKWSKFDDPLRAINNALKIEDYAFHTGIEENPWWMIDLEQEEYIEYIEIQNSKKNPDNIKKVQVFYSLDNKEWFFIDSSMYEFIYTTGGGIDKFLVLLNSYIKVRFIKIVLNAKGCLHLNKIKIFKRKTPGLIVATRVDLFGGRMIAILNAMYLSKKSGLKFSFVWNDRKETEQEIGIIDSEENVFDKNYIEEYSYTSTIKCGYKTSKMTNYTHLKNYLFFEERYGWLMNHNGLLNHNIIEDIDIKDYKNTIPLLWKEIGFSERYAHILQLADNIQKQFIAIHIRSGNAIMDDLHRKIIFLDGIITRVFPVEIAVDLIFSKINTQDIMLFSADFDAINKIKAYFNKQNFKNKIYLPDDFLNETLNDHERVLFDVALMSKAKEIYTPNLSTYSLLASMINQSNIIKIDDIYTPQEQINVINKHFDLICDIHPFQKSASWAYAYYIASKTIISKEEKVVFLNKSLIYDIENSAYRINLLQILLDEKNHQAADEYLKHCLYERKEEFLDTFFRKFPGNKKTAYEYLYEKILDARKGYFYISYVAAKIAEYYNDDKKFVLILKDVFQNYDENVLFADLKTTYLSLTTRSSKNTGAVDIIKSRLSYKLGNEILTCKGFLEYARLPFRLLCISKTHKQSQSKFKLSEYEDYEESLEYVSSMEYKLGSLLITARKNWYKGGYIKFIFDIIKLKNSKKSKE
ncbi:discoidin domain-containing protein [Campylobacter lari]|uniref:discoidin domain-containing protein n=1 Tax=Campylobacter lari TaxID=201 RepID=UPI0039903D57